MHQLLKSNAAHFVHDFLRSENGSSHMPQTRFALLPGVPYSEGFAVPPVDGKLSEHFIANSSSIGLVMTVPPRAELKRIAKKAVDTKTMQGLTFSVGDVGGASGHYAILAIDPLSRAFLGAVVTTEAIETLLGGHLHSEAGLSLIPQSCWLDQTLAVGGAGINSGDRYRAVDQPSGHCAILSTMMFWLHKYWKKTSCKDLGARLSQLTPTESMKMLKVVYNRFFAFLT